MTKLYLDMECDYFAAKSFEDVLEIFFKNGLMLRSIDLEFRDQIIDYLNFVSNINSIKVVVIINHFKESRIEEYNEFYKMLFDKKLRKNDVSRMCRSLDQLILEIVKSDKFFISATCGKLVPQLFGVSLACDFRIITENTRFENAFLKFGNIPKGGGAYFLGKKLGHCKAAEIMLQEKEISADEALAAGIVNKLVPLDELEIAAFEAAKRFSRLPASSLSGIKKLLNYPLKDLADYLEFETQELINALKPTYLGCKQHN